MYTKRRILFAIFIGLMGCIVLIAQVVTVDSAGRINGLANPQAANDAATKAYVDAQINAVWPVGVVYIQYPQQSAPNALWPNTNWVDISNNYAGSFFRAEGGRASAFESGQQGDAIRNITGQAGGLDDGMETGLSGPFYDGGGHAYDAQSQGSGSGWKLRFDASRVVPTAEENRPVNYTIRIWKRTS
jgi:hypothetical protein